ncbi:rhomboid family intramembrane serine protease [Streptomyces sp. NPDC005438]|uniref:rhomboid family intramembrane serine protease n=1 Tax=Streptomyces sp. NPDC005438 TaxID=3156880 RepID=UPI00339E2B7C
MAGERQAADGATGGLRGCYRHPDRETGISCARCGKPICPECMISASVGFQCPDCVRQGQADQRSTQPRTLAGGSLAADPRLVVKIILSVNVLVFLAVQVFGDRLVTETFMLGYAAENPYDPRMLGVADGEWYRMVTSAFLHEDLTHILFNMLSLWFLGGPLEAALGRSRFVLLYLMSALGGSTLFYLLAAQTQPALGASGAIFGLFGAMAVVMRRLNYDLRPVAVLLGINLLLTFTWDGIAWQAHIGGLVVGAVLAYAMVHAPREKRALYQYGTAGALLLVMVVACGVHTAQLLG